jgi:hypothetical protein
MEPVRTNPNHSGHAEPRALAEKSEEESPKVALPEIVALRSVGQMFGGEAWKR